MNNEDKTDEPLKSGEKNVSDGSRELDEAELEDVAGGIAWHGRLDERRPTSRWETRDEW